MTHTTQNPKDAVTVRVPASTSNLGPGFDTLGVALRLYNFVTVRRTPGRAVALRRADTAPHRDGGDALVSEAAQTFFKRARVPAFGVEVSLKSGVPMARGLGSSATLRLGVVAGLDALTGAGLDRQQLLELVTELEHHPDNTAPATYGGFTAAGFLDRGVRCLRFHVSPKLKFVTLIPRYEISTVKSRRLLPPTFSRADTVHNLNRAALISAAFASGNYEALRGILEDRVHQPYRETLIPQLPKIIRAGERAGAIGGWLCGSGPTVICITLNDAAAVARAMQRYLKESEVLVLSADNEGFKVQAK